MSDPTKLPKFEASTLRDHGTQARIESIWQRLESEVSRDRPQPRNVLLWAPAAVVIVFGAGVFVGARWSKQDVTGASAALPPAPQITAEPGGAAESAVVRPKQHPALALQGKRSIPPAVATVTPSVGHLHPQLSPPLVAQPSSQAGPMEWERLANVAEYAAAFRALDEAGGFEAALSHATAEQAMLLHDIARFSGQRQRAIQALRHVVDEHPGDPYAPTAAYTLGNMLDNAGDAVGAAEAFGIYRRLAPKGDFVEDALTRQLDVAIQQRDVELARRLVDQYANEFPSGRRLGEMRKRVAQLAGSDGSRAAPEDKPSEQENEGPRSTVPAP